jgi:hypothetical protein
MSLYEKTMTFLFILICVVVPPAFWLIGDGAHLDEFQGVDPQVPCYSTCEKFDLCRPELFITSFDTMQDCLDECSFEQDHSSLLSQCIFECDTVMSCEDWFECYLDCAIRYE